MMELLVKNRRKKSKGNTFPDREILEGKIFPREGKSRGFSLLSLGGKKSVIYRDFP